MGGYPNWRSYIKTRDAPPGMNILEMFMLMCLFFAFVVIVNVVQFALAEFARRNPRTTEALHSFGQVCILGLIAFMVAFVLSDDVKLAVAGFKSLQGW